MSAILSQPPRPTLPSLPTEILLYIFRLATIAPGLLDPGTIVDPSFLREKERLKQSSQALVTKRYLVRVSKYFYKVATPLLYEHILVVRGRALPKILATLEGSARRDSENTSEDKSLGAWVKRIDFVIRDGVNIIRPVPFLEYAQPILGCVPNLKILVINNAGMPLSTVVLQPATFLEPLPFKKSLEALNIVSAHSFPRSWFPILSSFSNLRAIADIATQQREDRTPGPNLELPSLEALTTSRPSPINFSSNLSGLRRWTVSVYDYNTSTLIPRTSSTILLNHGHQLTHIQVLLFQEWPQRFEGLEQYCPNLHRLDITLNSWTHLPTYFEEPGGVVRSLHIPPPVITLGFECLTKQAGSYYHRQLVFLVERMQWGPSFKKFVFMEQANAIDLRDRHANIWKGLGEISRRRGFQVLGSDEEELL